MFSKTCEYAIRASIFIAKESTRGSKSTQREIAEAIGSPVAFTAKILQQLVREKLIQSHKGPKGGFFIEKPEKLFLIDIVNAIGGEQILNKCVLGLSLCNDKKPCPIHFKYLPVKTEMISILENSTIKEMVNKLEDDSVKLRR